MKLIRLVVLALCIVFTFGQPPSQDIRGLLEFKKGITHDPTGYVLNSWNDESIDFNGCPSSWNGIMCNGRNIAAVILDNLGISAEVDLSIFANFTMLIKLSISNNSISGKLPKNIGDFRKLQYLDISDNLFSSTLPPEIGKISSLKNLSLAGNSFSGHVPDSVSGLTSIQSLDLSRNSLSGAIPSVLTKLTDLVYLNLSHNGFTEKIPRGFQVLPRLEVLDLHGNLLEGDLDPEFFLLTTATHVDFSENLLTSAPSHHQNLLPPLSDNLEYLNLSQNQLTGLLVGASETQAFGSLMVLDLSYNQLSGELPGFNFVYDLQVLKLSNNKFSGFVPNGLLKGDSIVLIELDLSGNNLTGPISLITSTSLRVLNLSSNALSGELPLTTGSCVVIDLSKNGFEGNLTRMLKWGNLEVLDLSQNRLSGNIPEITAQFLRLNFFNLSHNVLNGSLPRVLTRFPKLTVLDLGFNQLDGSLTNLLAVPTLQELHLQNNTFAGSIDFSRLPSTESNLRILDLSHNQFDGLFPNGFASFTALQILNIAGNNFSGSLPTSIVDTNLLSSLDVSQNNFTGPLPTNFPSSLQSFNASYNDLYGVVPDSLRKFPLTSFYPGNSKLLFPNPPTESGQAPTGSSHKSSTKTVIKLVIIIACVVIFVILFLVTIFIYYHLRSRRPPSHVTHKDVNHQASRNPPMLPGGEPANRLVVSSDFDASPKGYSDPNEKIVDNTGFSPSKTTPFSWSPESGDSHTPEKFGRLDIRSPDQLLGELYFLDDTISFTSEELSRAPADVLGRSSHGTSYRATLDNGLLLTVKWLREGVAKQRKEFTKEAKKFSNIRHPNVVGLRGYYWGPTQHEKLIISDYIAPGSLASFLYDRPGRKNLALTWAQRLKIAVDVARGLNYLHFDRALPHGNLKATNILLDGADLSGRVADYCLHRLMTQAGTIEQILDAGVLGYRAPELAVSKKPVPSFKSDVYSFGVILLELLTGKCAGDVVSGEDGGVDLTDWVRLRVAEGRGGECFDSALQPDMGNAASEKAMKETLAVSLRCIRSVSERPGIKTIYEDLSSI